MIDLTPLDVRKKRGDFKRAVRGYDALQVDAFLEVVADRLEQLVREHGSYSDKIENLEHQLKSYQERERALNEALLAAQELREEARSQAERDAAVRLREAETHAEAILLDADQAIRHSQRRLEDLRLRRGQFIKSLATMIERFEDHLELENTRLEAEPDDLGDLLERLQSDIGENPRGGGASARKQATGESGQVSPAGGPVAETVEVARNGDTPREPDRGPTVREVGEATEVSTPEEGARIAPESITPADAGGSGAASS